MDITRFKCANLIKKSKFAKLIRQEYQIISLLTYINQQIVKNSLTN